MTTIIYALILFVIVFLAHIPTPINGKTGQILGPLWGAALYLLSGTAALLLYVLVTAPSSLTLLVRAPWYAYLNAAVNIIVVGAIMTEIARVGVGVMFTCTTMGRFIMALVADHFDVLGIGSRPVTLTRVLAVLAIITGSILYTFFNRRKLSGREDAPKQETKRLSGSALLLNALVCVSIGFVQVGMDSINTAVGFAIGTVPAILLYLGLGGVLVFAIGMLKQPQGLQKMLHIPPIHIIPGVVNVVIVGVPLLMIPVLGVSVYTGIQFFSASIASMIMDSYGWFGMPVVKLGYGRIIGSVIMLLGVIALA